MSDAPVLLPLFLRLFGGLMIAISLLASYAVVIVALRATPAPSELSALSVPETLGSLPATGLVALAAWLCVFGIGMLMLAAARALRGI